MTYISGVAGSKFRFTITTKRLISPQKDLLICPTVTSICLKMLYLRLGAPAEAASALTDIVHHDALPFLRKSLSWKQDTNLIKAQLLRVKPNMAGSTQRRLFSPSPGVMVSSSTPIFGFFLRLPHDYPSMRAEAGGRSGLRPGVGGRGRGENRHHPPWQSPTGYNVIISTQTLV